MGTIHDQHKATGLLLDTARAAFLPDPMAVGLGGSGEYVRFEFESVADVTRWAHHCDAELVSGQRFDAPRTAVLFFRSDLFGLSLLAWAPLPAAAAPLRHLKSVSS